MLNTEQNSIEIIIRPGTILIVVAANAVTLNSKFCYCKLTTIKVTNLFIVNNNASHHQVCVKQ